jgi:hypothetical protein
MIKRFNQYEIENLMLIDFMENLNNQLAETTIKNLNLTLDVPNLEISGNILHKSVDNLLINSGISVDDDISYLATICSLTIMYIDEIKDKDKQNILIKESKSLLEELYMGGVSQNSIKGIIESIKSIINLVKLIKGNFNVWDIDNKDIIIINSIVVIIDKYGLNLDTMSKNFIGIEVGVKSTHTKNAIWDIINSISPDIKVNSKKLKNLNLSGDKNIELIKGQ